MSGIVLKNVGKDVLIGGFIMFLLGWVGLRLGFAENLPKTVALQLLFNITEKVVIYMGLFYSFKVCLQRKKGKTKNCNCWWFPLYLWSSQNLNINVLVSDSTYPLFCHWSSLACCWDRVRLCKSRNLTN